MEHNNEPTFFQGCPFIIPEKRLNMKALKTDKYIKKMESAFKYLEGPQNKVIIFIP